MAAKIHHNSLGTIRGIEADGVHKYLGLSYASLSGRFADAQLVSRYPKGITDATHLGPTVISPPNGCSMEHSLIQQSLPYEVLPSSETEGLNLNVFVPSQHKSSLPVFVYVHGGGFTIGSGAWPPYDLAGIVKLSENLGSPVIGITINYRLGAFGFLTSAELKSAGFKANRGLRDQQVALRWIQKHISGFGGDPANVTFVGESAGGVAGTLHLQSEERLFTRLVSLGGTSLLMKPLPPFVADYAYKRVADALDLGSMDAGERVKGLLEIPAEELLAKCTPDIPLLPVLDSPLLTSNVTHADWRNGRARGRLPGLTWCESLLIGDCGFDGSIFSYMIQPRATGIAATFRKSVTATLGGEPQMAQSLMQAYGITENVPDNEALVQILRFASDIGFYAPMLSLASGWPGESYLYHFNELNPWDGPGKGEATHVLDVAFLFQNYNQFLSADQKTSAQEFAKHVIAFVNGGAPFPAHSSKNGGAQVYGGVSASDSGKSDFVMGTAAAPYGRKDTILKLIDTIGLDTLSQAWDSFLGGH
ncbi:hypothetical protein LTR84_001310 [Exophiala bonariae]|uniref:Carboxylesterase type B domain-containing protein n=1 Tax=Exophiala bonariae TaxID=1690606 RepID=A0AAV9NDF0_9EURO|nr:hypothetical protein LTR84_001310 [Exophiala bonariae]